MCLQYLAAGAYLKDSGLLTWHLCKFWYCIKTIFLQFCIITGYQVSVFILAMVINNWTLKLFAFFCWQFFKYLNYCECKFCSLKNLDKILPAQKSCCSSVRFLNAISPRTASGSPTCGKNQASTPVSCLLLIYFYSLIFINGKHIEPTLS